MSEPKKWYEDREKLIAQVKQAENDFAQACRDSEGAAERMTRGMIALEAIYEDMHKAEELPEEDRDLSHQPVEESPTN